MEGGRGHRTMYPRLPLEDMPDVMVRSNVDLPHHINNLEFRTAARYFAGMLRARVATVDNPVGELKVSCALASSGIHQLTYSSIMDEANRIPREYTDGYYVVCTKDANGTNFYYLRR